MIVRWVLQAFVGKESVKYLLITLSFAKKWRSVRAKCSNERICSHFGGVGLWSIDSRDSAPIAQEHSPASESWRPSCYLTWRQLHPGSAQLPIPVPATSPLSLYPLVPAPGSHAFFPCHCQSCVQVNRSKPCNSELLCSGGGGYSSSDAPRQRLLSHFLTPGRRHTRSLSLVAPFWVVI